KIPGAGAHVITPASPLPAITDPVVIDGYTQPGAHVNTRGPWQGTNAQLMIVIDGSAAGNGANGLEVAADGCAIRGLVIARFSTGSTAGIRLTGNNNTVAGCFLGANTLGNLARANHIGVAIDGGAGNTVGGTTPAAVNLLSGNTEGVYLT